MLKFYFKTNYHGLNIYSIEVCAYIPTSIVNTCKTCHVSMVTLLNLKMISLLVQVQIAKKVNIEI